MNFSNERQDSDHWKDTAKKSVRDTLILFLGICAALKIGL